MKLNLVKANINTFPDASQVYLSMLKKPFYFTYYKGVLYVNDDLADLDKIFPQSIICGKTPRQTPPKSAAPPLMPPMIWLRTCRETQPQASSAVFGITL